MMAVGGRNLKGISSKFLKEVEKGFKEVTWHLV